MADAVAAYRRKRDIAMKCDNCNKTATVHLTEIKHGKKIEKHLCEQCAAQNEGRFDAEAAVEIASGTLGNRLQLYAIYPANRRRSAWRFSCAACPSGIATCIGRRN